MSTLQKLVRAFTAPLRAFRPIERTPYGNRLPKVIHSVVERSKLKPGRLVIVGDVHGCYDELQDLMTRCKYNSEDNLVLVGDLVNKGPKSREVIHLAQQEGALVVRGNHDDAVLSARERQVMGQTVKPRMAWITDVSPDELAYLNSLPYSLSLPDYGVLVVHAGLVPGRPLQQQRLKDIYRMRDLQEEGGEAANGTRWSGVETSTDGSTPWALHWTGPEHVFFGHDAKRGLQLQDYCTGLDTGCCYGRNLTAAILPPLAQLEGRPEFARKRREGAALTRHDLAAELVSVSARAVYEQPKGPVISPPGVVDVEVKGKSNGTAAEEAGVQAPEGSSFKAS